MKPDTQLSKRNFWIIVLNSTSAYVLAYLLVFYINHFTKLITASLFSIPAGFDWDQTYFYIENYQWTHDMVTTIYSSGLLLNFLLGLISLGIFYSIYEEITRLKIFLIWFTLLSFNLFFSNLLIGNLFTKGIGYVFQWAFFTDTTKVLIAMVGFFGLIATAFVMKRPILYSANAYFVALNERNFPFFFTAQITVPFVVGTLLSVFYFYPRILFQERYSWLSLALVLLILFLGINDEEPMIFDPDEPPPPIRISKIFVIAAVILYVGLRILFNSRHTFP